MAKTAEVKPEIFEIDQDDFNHTIAAIRDLGLRSTARHLILEYEQAATVLDSRTKHHIGTLARNGNPELVSNLPLIKTYGLKDLRGRFDRKQRYRTLVDEELWDQYGNYDLNNGMPKPKLGVVINEYADPYNIYSKSINGFDEQGLVGVGKTVREFSTHGLRMGIDHVSTLNVSQYIVLQAKRRLAGEPPLDLHTKTAFPQLFYSIRDRRAAPIIGWSRDRLELGSMSADYSGPDIGIRHVVNTSQDMLVAPR